MASVCNKTIHRIRRSKRGMKQMEDDCVLKSSLKNVLFYFVLKALKGKEKS